VPPRKIFIDTNVLLDVLLRRDPFYDGAARIWTLCEQGKRTGYISAISFNNAFYIIRKNAGIESAKKALRLLRNVFNLVPLDQQVLNQAIDAGFTDFEDAIQFHSALHVDAQFILTRNVSHFPADDIPALTPADFLAAHSNS
jgi:predicted nucleic acid-binding protein